MRRLQWVIHKRHVWLIKCIYLLNLFFFFFVIRLMFPQTNFCIKRNWMRVRSSFLCVCFHNWFSSEPTDDWSGLIHRAWPHGIHWTSRVCSRAQGCAYKKTRTRYCSKDIKLHNETKRVQLKRNNPGRRPFIMTSRSSKYQSEKERCFESGIVAGATRARRKISETA